jgi:hypothetical protein
MRLLCLSLMVLCGFGCATTGDLDTLKPTTEAVHLRAKAHDFRGLADLIVADKRAAFLRAREKNNDERDLFITDYELQDALVSPDKLKAVCESKISWYRLPSVSEKTETVRSTFVWINGAWRLEQQDGGPFAQELSLGGSEK